MNSFTKTVSQIKDFVMDFSSHAAIKEGKGSFRGAQFYIIDHAVLNGGRHVVRHEYPLRDDGETEDLGLTMRKYTFNAIVFGDNYTQQRDALIAALETKGSGELNHPVWGKLTVQIETFDAKESCTEGRVATFNITCAPAAASTAPTVKNDFNLPTEKLGFAVLTDVGNAWKEAVQLINNTTEAIKVVEQTINTIKNTVMSLTYHPWLTKLIRDVLTIKRGIVDTVEAAKGLVRGVLAVKKAAIDLANEPKQVFKKLQQLFKDIAASPFDTQSTKALEKTLADIEAQPISNLPDIAKAQRVISIAIKTLAASELARLLLERAKEETKPKAAKPNLSTSPKSSNSLFGSRISDTDGGITPPHFTAGFAAASSQSSGSGFAEAQHQIPQFETVEDIRRSTRKVERQLADLMIETGDLGWYATSSQLRAIRLDFIQQMNSTAIALPAARTLTTHDTEPALVTLYRETGNAQRWVRFTRRNGIRHSAFVLGGRTVEVIND